MRIRISKAFNAAWFGMFILGGAIVTNFPTNCAFAQAQTQPLVANDVSWLFPPPKQAADLAKLISVADLSAPNPQNPAPRDSVWSDAVFQQFLAIAASSAGQVGDTTSRIGLPEAAKSKSNWFVAGVRIDAGAPDDAAKPGRLAEQGGRTVVV